MSQPTFAALAYAKQEEENQARNIS